MATIDIATILKILAIPCMLTFIVFYLAMIFAPESKLVDYFRSHKRAQVILGIMFCIGLISAFVAVL
ncbi:MAG: hypothetical protein HFJ43_02410 [Clostridia bacterium]|nr:hypothetical protein [Clostridia bacterium]